MKNIILEEGVIIRKQNEFKMVEVIDLNNNIIKLPEGSGLYYTENDKNYSIRYDFNNSFDSIEHYMLKGYEPISIEEFDKKELETDNYNGKFIFKVVLNDGSILIHEYTFIGFEEKDVLKLAPVKIPKINRFSVDPTKILNFNWYYLNSDIDESEYIELIDLLEVAVDGYEDDKK